MRAPARRPLYSAEDLADAWAWTGETLDAAIHTEISHKTVSQWATEKRILPEGLTPLPGPFRWENSPCMREIADCFSAESPVREVAVMKGAQVTFTVAVLENDLGYMIDCEPGGALFVSGDAKMAEDAVELRIDRMLQSSGIAHKIFSQSEKKGNKKSGDTVNKKEFPGGFLLAIGPNSAAKMRQFPVKYLFLDEVDAYGANVQNEGDPLSLLKRRTVSYEATRKILYGSTPLVKQTSKIEPLFLLGDQRRYHVPCKKCGKLQPLEWHQIKYDKDEKTGELIYSSVRYECSNPECRATWKNEDKVFFLPEEGCGGKAKWIPTAKSKRPGLRSYHVSSLYSSIGMQSWESIVEEWLEIGDSLEKRRAFINTVLGETFEERGAAPPWEKIMDRREPYRVESRGILPNGETYYTPGEWPDGAYLLTLGGDVQENRIEAEIVAWGADKESWSLGYFVMTGNTKNENDKVWDELYALLISTHAGHSLSLALIDAGFNTDAVYRFCERFDGRVFPSKGDPRVGVTRRAFAVRDVVGYSCRRVDLDVDLMKQVVYADIDKCAPDAGQPYPPGYAHFSTEYDAKYFQMLTAEERIKQKNKLGQEKWVWNKPEGRRNEALDARVYNLGALYVLATAAAGDESGAVDWSVFWEALKTS